jgi:hypothetical protein
VDYRVADLLDLPTEWDQAFDLVVEIFTLQALPDPPRELAADAVTGLVADRGTLLAVAFRDAGSVGTESGPPFPLDRHFMESLARGGLHAVLLEETEGPRWRATYRRWSRARSDTSADKNSHVGGQELTRRRTRTPTWSL